MQIVFSVIVMLVDLFVAIVDVTGSVAIMQLEVSAALMQVTVSASNLTIFIVFMQVGVSVAIMQIVRSVVHNCFYYKMQVTVSVIAMHVTLSSNIFILLSLSGTHY